jgi:uncharacterized protein YjbI with pentapeptide repeats
MSTTIEAGKHRAEHVALTGTSFRDVCLGDAEFDNVSFVRAKLHNVNLSDVQISYFQMGGAKFTVGGSHPDYGQKPISFEKCQLVATSFRDCDLTQTSIEGCKLDGMRIDGILVTDLLAAYRRRSD